MSRALALLALSLVCAPSRAEVTVRVRETPGGPQIHLNGAPIPPRFFWGAQAGGALRLGSEWQDYSFDCEPGAVDRTGTLHFRFAQQPGALAIADLRIVDTASGADVFPPGSFATPEAFAAAWRVWPQGEANTVGSSAVVDGALQVTLTAPPAGKGWPDYHLYSDTGLSFEQGRSYRVSFRARADSSQLLRSQLYDLAGGSWTPVGGPPGAFLHQVALARDAGVRLVSFSAPECWLEPERPQSWAPLDRLCREIIAVHPTVLLVPRVGADAPGWWLDRHPESRMVYDGDQVLHHSCVSDRLYRAEVCAHLEKLCRHLTETFPDHFAGIHPCGQNTGEWFYQNTWERPLSGYDADTREAFREWLAGRGDPGAAAAEPPGADERRAHPFGFLRDPAREGRLIEFARFQQEEMAEHVAAMAAACRRGTEGRKLVVFFYGYLFEFAPAQCGAPTCGHYALSTVLRSPDIDILCSPISYTDRDWLGTAPSMTTAESVNRAGILWLNEDDSRTFLDTRVQEHVQEGGLVDLRQTQQVMLRNTAQAALRGFGTWWMDLPAQGWFDDARIWEELVRLQPVDRAMARRARRFTPEIAAVLDEDSMCHLTGGSEPVGRGLIYDCRAALGRCGAPYGQYLLRDLLEGRVDAKLQVLLAAWALTADQRAGLERLRATESTRVWCYAPGYIRPDRLDVAGIEEVTGFAARPVEPETTMVTPTEAGRALGLTEPWGVSAPVRPLFTVEAEPEETLATYADGSPAVVLRRAAHGSDVFLGVPRLTPALVRALARHAGVHLFTQRDAAVWAAEGFVSVQAHEAGTFEIDTGTTGPVADALDGAGVGQGPVVRLSFEPGETRVLRY